MPFTEDLAPFFNASEFATSGTLNGVAVTGIFDSAFEVSASGTPGFASSLPGFQLPTASVPASPVGKLLVIGSASYTVVEHHPDGTGVSTLMLERAA